MGTCMQALDQNWHAECFTCKVCGKNLCDTDFYPKDNELYCLQDYYSVAADRCFSCGTIIAGPYSELGGLKWHVGHVGCIICGKGQRESIPNFQVNGLPMCLEHATEAQAREREEVTAKSEEGVTDDDTVIKHEHENVMLVDPIVEEKKEEVVEKIEKDIVINRVTYRCLSIIGKGMHSETWKVLSPNYHVYTAKVINLSTDPELEFLFDEIYLRKQIQVKADVVTKIIDYSIDTDLRNEVIILTEYGEISLADKVIQLAKLTSIHEKENAARAIWQEILHVVDTIHSFIPAHGYLNPHKFVFVGGILKLNSLGMRDGVKAVKSYNEYLAPEPRIQTEVGTEFARGHN